MKHKLQQVQETLKLERAHLSSISNEAKALDELCSNLEEENHELKDHINNFADATNQCLPQTKDGNRYSNEIRYLYYQLLSERISPAKIERTIKIILNTLFPHINTTEMSLPKGSLATRMRSSELPTISTAHQAVKLAEAKTIHLNTDGTTFNQTKVQSTILNGIVTGVHEVSDGSAKATFDEIDLVVTKLRKVATELKMEGAASIGWGLVSSVMSDKAATQRAFNRLVQEKKDANTTTTVGTEVIEMFCGMHVGVNLRAAEVKGLRLKIGEVG